MTISGTMKQLPFGGVWVVVTPEGKRYQVDGDVQTIGDLRVDGLAVTLEGEVDKDRMSIGMSAPILRVTRWAPA